MGAFWGCPIGSLPKIRRESDKHSKRKSNFWNVEFREQQNSKYNRTMFPRRKIPKTIPKTRKSDL